MRILLDKILKSKIGCPQNFFSKLKNIYIDHEKNVKKIQKNPGTAPVPGLKVFFRVKIVVSGFLKIFFMDYMYIF